MPLAGTVSAAPEAIHGFDANTKLTAKSAGALRAAGFGFAIRYLTRSDKPPPGDLDTSEANIILNAGLALMAVQHVASAGWTPTEQRGVTNGENAVAHAQDIGLPEGMNIWLDLEGVNGSVGAETVIAYCNAWFDKAREAKYVPGIYVGANANLTGEQLYWRLKTQYYWKSGSNVPDIPQRGYCMVQRIVLGDTMGGVAIDRNVIKKDAFGLTPLWLKQ